MKKKSKPKSNIVEIDKDLFKKYIKKYTLTYGYVEPIVFAKLVFCGFGKARRSATIKRNASKLSIKRGER